MTRSGKVALVTGANRGIGFEIASQLARLGDHVIVGSRNPKSAEGAVKRIHSTAAAQMRVVQLDVTEQTSVAAVKEMVASEFGGLDILVNNAAILLDEGESPSVTSMDNLGSTLETNLIGAWRMCSAFVPSMKERRYGRIVNVSSGAGSFGELANSTYAPAYSVSKAALNALTATLAYELKSCNVLINAVCPGWVRTRMGGAGAPGSPAEGADTAVWLATLPDGGPTGGFFRDRCRIPW
ncbi:MAG: SDR family oxidoreductase [Nitrososphaerota archaeon]|nr:SDR family oxidoreductase [Nitrososphaerota archaeon]